MNGASSGAPGAFRGVVKVILICGVAAAAIMSAPAAAQSQPLPAEPDAYRALGAKHLYGLYGDRIFKGRLPPLLYAVAIVETEIDEEGNVLSAVVTREPASAKDVMPWILGLIKAASPFPKPALPGRTRYQDVWLVDRGYTFQLHTLTEGQRWNE